MSRQIDFDKRKQAFRLYLRYRNKSQVAKELGIPPATIFVWSKDEDWDNKVKDVQSRLQGALGALKRAQDNVLVQDQIDELKLLEHLEVAVAELLIHEDVRPTKWEDVIKTLDFVFKQKRLIQGEPTERNAIETTAMSEEDLDKGIQLFNKILPKKVDESNSPTKKGQEPQNPLEKPCVLSPPVDSKDDVKND